MSKHTPGPWTIRKYVDSHALRVDIYGQTGHVAHIGASDEENESHVTRLNANARLIAAAPELLAALWRSNQMLIALRDGDIPLSGMDETLVEDNWTVIKKAEAN